MSDSIQILVVAVLQILGVLLLAREVRIAHIVENLMRGFAFNNMLLQLYTEKNYRGLMVFCRLDQGDSIDQARLSAGIDDGGFTSEQALEESAKNMLGRHMEEWTLQRIRLEKYTAGTAPKQRRALLYFGAFCLIAGSVISAI